VIDDLGPWWALQVEPDRVMVVYVESQEKRIRQSISVVAIVQPGGEPLETYVRTKGPLLASLRAMLPADVRISLPDTYLLLPGTLAEI
jgi:hypothetical protein